MATTLPERVTSRKKTSDVVNKIWRKKVGGKCQKDKQKVKKKPYYYVGINEVNQTWKGTDVQSGLFTV